MRDDRVWREDGQGESMGSYRPILEASRAGDPVTPACGRSNLQQKDWWWTQAKDPRLVFECIVYVRRTGRQWKALPAERYGSASAIHARFLEWEKAGVFEALWKLGLAEHDGFEGIAWRWQCIDGAMMKAPLAQEIVGPNPTDRGRNGIQHNLMMDDRGVPLSLVVTGANRHDVSQLEAGLDAIVIERSNPPLRRPSICVPMLATPERQH